MFNVKEHIECHPILDSVVQGSREIVRPVAMVVDGPHREESSHALAGQHCAYVVLEYTAMQETEHHRDPDRAHQEFAENGHAQLSIPVSQSRDMQKNRKERSKQ